ncbi:MAG TPA: glycine dehydrogenase (aminomethyl-transferring) [Bacteroidetes bacterium]|nr:glycine dehydrogenase (aminomethyl-transferring) [Bacteroidota bacterium]
MPLSIQNYDRFEHRHNGPDAAETKQMLDLIGANSLDQLIDETVPASIRLPEPLDLPAGMEEQAFLNKLKGIASKNQIFKSYIGTGYYNCYTPGVILRNITENPAWYTAYTPYQAEIAQGRLEALINFQTLVMELSGMEIANASLLDEATAAAEAMHMALALKDKNQGMKFFISQECFPQTIDLLKTRSAPVGVELVVGNHKEIKLTNEFFGALVQYPANDGVIYDYSSFCADARAAKVMTCVSVDLLSLTLLTPPGEWGADIVIGSSQRFGVPLGYGGPHAGFLATKDEFKRSIPGRIIGVSIDAQGKTAYRMALQTREQHIRREKATSNICTAQVLLSVMASMYAVYHGPAGLKKIAGRIHGLTKVLDKGLTQLGHKVRHADYFDTLRVDVAGLSETIRQASVENKINFRYFDDHSIGISLDETTTLKDVQEILALFAQDAPKLTLSQLETSASNLEITWSGSLKRSSTFMEHPVFNSFHTEHEMLRYIRRLEQKDLSLVHSMISLGSCTMKLNATTEMMPITWPEFNQIHPFVPAEQATGYREIFDELSGALAEITGFAGVSLQPNAGAQGEYAGLLVIREYFLSRNEGHRNVALIPASAHGTNPASAVMAGMNVVVTKTDEKGNIDVADLKAKAEQYKDTLACLMVTYPSTHGVFEESIREITSIIHSFGGQVYMDGANMNAQVGLTSPGMIGADVCHLNLHKTFCIPHGGGGPGMGPICVAKHLVPFLPGHPVVKTGGDQAISAVSAAPWGSASILLISYAYIQMMGGEGLTNATKYAILNANYMQRVLAPYYKTLYKGTHNRVAHEMILDTRELKQSAGVEVEDIAKRLMDYGYHAPTVSFPVAGTLMIEPTESETKGELDRFCEAMISIRKEISEIENGTTDRENNALKNAPHTAEVVISDSWDRPYSREQAAFPTAWTRFNKFWPAVSRINNTYGDRNLMCACPPMENYSEELAEA